MSGTEPKRRKKQRLGGPSNIQDAWRILAGGSTVAAATLVEISKHGKSEASRVAASKTVLEFVGFGGRDVIPVRIVPPELDPMATEADGRTPASQIVASRMALLAAEPAYDPITDTGEVIDAELVEEPAPRFE